MKRLAFFRTAVIPFLLGLSVAHAQSLDFALPNTTGQITSLRDFANSKAVVVIFTSGHCTYADKYQLRIRELYNAFANKGVVFLAINSNNAALAQDDNMAVMRTGSPYPFPYLKDENQAVARQFNATKNPEVFLLQPQGAAFSIIYQGKIDDNPLDATQVRDSYLQNALSALLLGNAKPASTTPTGCNIRWE